MKDRISKMMMIFSFHFLNWSKVKCQKSYFDRHASFGGYNVDIKRKFRLECWSRRQQIIGHKSGQLSIGYKEEEEEDGSFLVGWGPSCCLSSYVTLFVVLSWVEVNDLEVKAQKGISAQISWGEATFLFERGWLWKQNKSIENVRLCWKSWLFASKESRVIRLCLRSISNGDKDAASAINWTSPSNYLPCCIFFNEFCIMVVGGKNTSLNFHIEDKCVVADDLFGFFSDLGNGTYNFFERVWPRV